MTKLEQVALSLFDCTAEQWARKSANFREAAMKDVRRSVEALRDPTDGMRAAANSMTDLWPPEDIWHAMIDAILSEKPDAG